MASVASPIPGVSPLAEQRPVNLLIAEDNEFAWRTLSSQLQIIFARRGVSAKITLVGDGLNAKKALCREEFDLVSPTTLKRKHSGAQKVDVAFMDCQFPHDPDGSIVDLEGILVTEAVRKDEEDIKRDRTKTPRHVRILSSSADSDQSKFTEIFDDVLAKGSPVARIESALVNLGVFTL